MKNLDSIAVRIQQLNLERIKDWLVMEKGWSRAYADQIEPLYKRFLIMRIRFPDSNILSTPAIEQMWDAHLWHTKKYVLDFTYIFSYSAGFSDEDFYKAQRLYKVV